MNEDFSEVKPWLQPRSKGSDINSRAFYRFVNCTGFEVELFWLDFDGNRVSYGILKSVGHDTALNIDTFESHPWQAVPYTPRPREHNAAEAVAETYQTALPLNGKFLLYPSGANRRVRRVVLITRFVSSLKSLCLQTILRACPEDPARLRELELPLSVLRDLRTFAVYGFCP